MDKLEKPIRVIHIEKTLNCKNGGIHFKRPRDWDFCVLSHTWRDLVRRLSEKIGQRIGAQVGKDRDAYSVAFQNEDFRQEPCYPHLLEIFQMLYNDDVELIWFDALCINQTLEKEKSHEINNMGSYFSLSQRTYVLSHGFGEVNEMWGDATGDLPRWFTRVWTFPEFLLPRQLTFLVEGDIDDRFAAVINMLIQQKAKKGFCKCFLDIPSKELDELFFRSLKDEDLEWMGGFELRNPHWKSILELIEERSPCISAFKDSNLVWNMGPTCYKYLAICCKDDTKSKKLYFRDLVQEKQLWDGKQALCDITYQQKDKSIICGELSCRECTSRPMIREAKKRGKQTGYFFDREVFLALMQCHSRMMQNGSSMKEPSWGIQVLRGLYCALATEGNWKPCHVICEIGWRSCTYDEDRVLAILGLLGLKFRNLRTGKTLPEQIIELAKVGGSAMLVELCTVNQKGGTIPNMSWAPDFHGQNEKLEHADRPKEVYMQVENLSASGQLQVRAKVIHGRVVFDYTEGADQAHNARLIVKAQQPTRYPYQTTEANCSVLPLKVSQKKVRSENTEMLLLIYHFEFEDHSMKETGSFEVPIQYSAECNHQLPKLFPVNLLLLGRDEMERKLLLICLSDQLFLDPIQLHKIGCIALDKDVHPSLHHFFDSCDIRHRVIGGFGEDLTQYIYLQIEDPLAQSKDISIATMTHPLSPSIHFHHEI